MVYDDEADDDDNIGSTSNLWYMCALYIYLNYKLKKKIIYILFFLKKFLILLILYNGLSTINDWL